MENVHVHCTLIYASPLHRHMQLSQLLYANHHPCSTNSRWYIQCFLKPSGDICSFITNLVLRSLRYRQWRDLDSEGRQRFCILLFYKRQSLLDISSYHYLISLLYIGRVDSPYETAWISSRPAELLSRPGDDLLQARKRCRDQVSALALLVAYQITCWTWSHLCKWSWSLHSSPHGRPGNPWKCTLCSLCSNRAF